MNRAPEYTNTTTPIHMNRAPEYTNRILPIHINRAPKYTNTIPPIHMNRAPEYEHNPPEEQWGDRHPLLLIVKKTFLGWSRQEGGDPDHHRCRLIMSR
jgi:hypothetical protein